MKVLLIKSFTLLCAIFTMMSLYASDLDSDSDSDLAGEMLQECRKPKSTTFVSGPLQEKSPEKWQMLVKCGKVSFKNDAGLSIALNQSHDIQIDGAGCISYAMKGEVVKALELGVIVLKLNEQFEKNIEHLMAKYDKCECKDAIHKEGCHKHKK